jgi:hypothetical protein
MPSSRRCSAGSWRLDPGAARAVALSAATRNSLVILPLAFAVPGGVQLAPAVVVTQTTIELTRELVCVQWLPCPSVEPLT